MTNTDPLKDITVDPQQDRPMMSVRDFEDGTTGVVRVLGDRGGVGVIFAGNKAKTNGNRVVLPKLNDGKMLTKRQVGAGRGYADHETAHNIFTDFENGGGAMREAKAAGNKLLARMINAVEDMRIEHAMGKMYPGSRSNLNKVGGHVARHFLENKYKENPDCVTDFKRIGPIAVTWAGRKAMGYEDPCIEAALSTLPDEMRAKVEKWGQMCLGLDTGVKGLGKRDKEASYKGCMDGVALAKLLVEKCEEEEEKGSTDQEGDDNDEREQEARDNEKEQEERDGGEGDDAEHSENRGEDEDTIDDGVTAEDGDGDEDEDDGGGEDEDEDDGGGEEEEGDNQPDPVDPDINQIIEKLMNEGSNGPGLGQYRTFTRAEDRIIGYPNVRGITDEFDEGVLSDHNLKKYTEIVRENSSRLGVMKRKIERALMAKLDVDWEGGHRRGRLGRRVLQVVGGNYRVFRKKIEGASIDTALVILNDLSASMVGPEMHLAGTASIAMAEALEGTGVNLEVAGFSEVNHYYRDRELRDECSALDAEFVARGQGEGFVRTAPCELVLFKAFDQTLRQARAAMGSIPTSSGGFTPIAPVMQMAWDRLKVQPESKKVMLVLTDGHPEWTNTTMWGWEQPTRDSIQVCIDAGCEMIGIGILQAGVSQFYPHWAVIHNLDDLTKTVLDEIGRMLLGEHFKVDNADLIKASAKSARSNVA